MTTPTTPLGESDREREATLVDAIRQQNLALSCLLDAMKKPSAAPRLSEMAARHIEAAWLLTRRLERKPGPPQRTGRPAVEATGGDALHDTGGIVA